MLLCEIAQKLRAQGSAFVQQDECANLSAQCFDDVIKRECEEHCIIMGECQIHVFRNQVRALGTAVLVESVVVGKYRLLC